MVDALLADFAIDDLRVIDEAGMRHTAARRTVVSTRQPGGVYTNTEVWLPGIPARYNPLALDAPQRADLPSSARKGTLAFTTGTQVKAGEQWRVSGTTNGEAWSKVVLIDEVLGPARSHELRRRTLVTDVAANG